MLLASKTRKPTSGTAAAADAATIPADLTINERRSILIASSNPNNLMAWPV
jgi:hypothetical protein